MSPHLRSHLLLLVTFIRRPTLARDGEKEGNAEQEEAQLPAVLLARCARGRPVAEVMKVDFSAFTEPFPTLCSMHCGPPLTKSLFSQPGGSNFQEQLGFEGRFGSERERERGREGGGLKTCDSS